MADRTSLLVPNALTTLARVKERMTIAPTGFDDLLDRMINSATSRIERACARTFKKADYVETYDWPGGSKRSLLLRQWPVSAVTKLEFRVGTPDVPAWQEFLDSNWALEEGGQSGIVRLMGPVSAGPEMIRATYSAGYLFDFAHENDVTKHSLPADLTELCERMVVRTYKKRDAEGKASEGNQGDNVSWREDIDADMRQTIEDYSRPAEFS